MNIDLAKSFSYLLLLCFVSGCVTTDINPPSLATPPQISHGNHTPNDSNESHQKTRNATHTIPQQIDITPPLPPKNVSAQIAGDKISIHWIPAANPDFNHFEIQLYDNKQHQFKKIAISALPQIELKGIKSFHQYLYRIYAIDHADNKSAPLEITADIYPDPRFQTGHIITNQIPENINTVMILARQHSPYLLSKNVRINKNGALLIEPGTVIKTSKQAKIEVIGEIQIFGDKKTPVVVEGLKNQPFKSFLILNSAKENTISGLQVTSAEQPLLILSGQPVIDHCEIVDSINAITIMGSSQPLIQNTIIEGSRNAGIIIARQALPIIEKNTFINSRHFHIKSQSPYRLLVKSNQWIPSASPATLSGFFDY